MAADNKKEFILWFGEIGIGDVPLVGCGTYANRFAGASCTGIGEKIIKVVLAKTVVDACENGTTAQDACHIGMARMNMVRGTGGVIAIDSHGNIGAAHNAPHMTLAVFGDDPQAVVRRRSRRCR